MDEYINLISQPNDDKAHFMNYLGKTFEFDNNDIIYCALKEISFSCKLQNGFIGPKSSDPMDILRLGILVPYITGARFREVLVPTGVYTTQSLVDVINARIQYKLGPSFLSQDCRLAWNKITNRIEFVLNGDDSDPLKRVSLFIFPSMSKILGLQNPDDSLPEAFLLGSDTDVLPSFHSHHPIHAVAFYEPSIKSFDLVLIYLSILKQQCIGHELVQLCDVIPKVKCAQGNSYFTYRVKNPKYVRVHEHLRRLSEVEVKLANESGDLLQFTPGSGETRITLHFLSKQLLYRH